MESRIEDNEIEFISSQYIVSDEEEDPLVVNNKNQTTEGCEELAIVEMDISKHLQLLDYNGDDESCEFEMNAELDKTSEVFVCQFCVTPFFDGNLYEEHVKVCVNSEVIPWKSTTKKWECFQCDFVGKNRSRLQSHLSVHFKEKVFKCRGCENSFKDNKGLKKHLKTCKREKLTLEPQQQPCDEDNKRLVCFKCNYITENETLLTQHFKEMHADDLFMCTTCQELFKQVEDFTQHIINCTDNKAMDSDMEMDTPDLLYLSGYEPGEQSSQEAEINTEPHEYEHQNSQVNVELNEYEIENFPRENEALETFNCQFCATSFNDGTLYDEHLKMCETPLSVISSVITEKESPKEKGQQHLSVYSEETRYLCRLCGKSFKINCNYWKHMKTCKGVKPISNAKYNCPECDYSTENSANLAKHSKLHTNKCYACGKKYYCLRRHAKKCKELSVTKRKKGVEEGPLRLKCISCEETFKRDEDLMNHRKICKGIEKQLQKHFVVTSKRSKITDEEESEAKPYQCPNCGNTYKFYRRFIGHLKSCKEEPPSTLKALLEGPMLLDKPGKQFLCPICGKEFEYNGSFNLNAHIANCKPRDLQENSA